MKYGKGDPTKQRGAWVFGGIQRGEGCAAFMAVCPNNKRTKEALWPIIEENTIIFSDGLQSHKKLNEIGYENVSVIDMFNGIVSIHQGYKVIWNLLLKMK